MKIEQFNSNFLAELFKLVTLKQDVCELVCENLEYSYIPAELKGFKHILKGVKRQYSASSKLPSLGVILQENALDADVYEAVDKINEAKVADKDLILKTLEEYLKRVKFQILFEKTVELYNNGKQDEAIELQAKESPKISEFSIYSAGGSISNIFKDFFKRDGERFMSANDSTLKKGKIPFGIDLLDRVSGGGTDPETGEIDCFLGRSGSGKTKWLRWRGISAARMGRQVLHIQAEGTRKECELGYDATWTGILKGDLKRGEIPPEVEEKLRRAIRDISKIGGSIEVVAYEQFETATLKDVREKVLDYKKRHGCYPDMLILDYLELFHPGNGRHYATTTEGEKFRREDCARAFKNICNEFKMAGATASQANDISPADYNNASWVMTRHNCSSAKGLVDPFSYFITWNVSSDEYKKHQGRLYVDKMREHESGQTIRICTDYAHDRFYSRRETLDTWPEDYEKGK